MKKLILLTIFVVAMLLSSCETVPIKSMGVSFTDGSKNAYSVDYNDYADSKKATAIVAYGGKTYGCMVDYKDSAPDGVGFAVDVSAADLTGSIKFTYKRVTVECEVTNYTTPQELYDSVSVATE